MEQIKPEFYDDFKCIADQCTFTCCKGWEIAVDAATFDNWKKDENNIEFLCSKVIMKRGKKEQAHIKIGSDKTCAFLDDRGLCKIVQNYSENYLSHTCRTFPRLETCYTGRKESSLSLACPEVIDMIHHRSDKIEFIGSSDIKHDELPNNLKLREYMLNLLQKSQLSLDYRFALVFHMLLVVRDNPVKADAILQEYSKPEFQQVFAVSLGTIEASLDDMLIETKELFLDIAFNYRKEKHYKRYLQEIYETASHQKLEEDQIVNSWKEFTAHWNEFEQFLENCMVMKVFAGCNNDVIDDIIVSFQLILLEYIMIRFSMFLKYLKKGSGKDTKTFSIQSGQIPDMLLGGEIDYVDVRDYIAVYTRIIGYNQDGMKEFLKESFEEDVWEFGYLLLLLGC